MALTPMPGDYVRVYRSTGADQNYADEAMQEVDRSAAKWGSQARYTIYRITAAAKRMMNDTALPGFEVNFNSAGWVTMPACWADIWYGTGYIDISGKSNLNSFYDWEPNSSLDSCLNSTLESGALVAADAIRCHTGKYLAATEVLGCATRSFEEKDATQDVTSFGDMAIARFPTISDWSGKLEVFQDSVTPTDWSTIKASRVAFRFYRNFSTSDMHAGFGYISDVDWIGGPASLLKCGPSIVGKKYKLRHVVG